jgi:hypothetical protein
VQGSELHFSTLPNGSYHSALSLMVASFGKDGAMITGMVRHGASDLEPGAYQKVSTNDFRVHQEVEIPVQATSVRLGVQDDLTNRLGTVDISLPIAIPRQKQKAKMPLPPIEAD